MVSVNNNPEFTISWIAQKIKGVFLFEKAEIGKILPGLCI